MSPFVSLAAALALLALAPLPLLAGEIGDPGACDARSLSLQGPEALKRTRNTVYARHGRAFTSPDLRAYFEQQPWYRVDPGYTDARLTAADKACVQRVGLFEKGKPVWSQEADLDGDGAAEGVFLFDTRPAAGSDGDMGLCEGACVLTLIAHETVREVRVGWKRGSDLGEVRAQVIDVDARDRRKEVIVTHLARSYEDPPGVHDVLAWDGGAVQLSRIEGSGDGGKPPAVPGDGLVRLTGSWCVGDRTRTVERRFALQRGKLVPTSEKVLSEMQGCAG